MKNWYLRHQKGAYYLWMVAGLFALIAAEILMLVRTGDVNTTALLIPFILWVLTGSVGHLCVSLRRNQSAINALNDNCDPTPLLDWADTELDYWSKHHGRKGYLSLCAMNRAVALHALGRNEEALSVPPDLKNLNNKRGEKVACFLNMGFFQLSLGHPLVAGQYVRQAEKAMANIPQGKPFAKQCAYSLELIRYELLLADKKTDGLREKLESLLSRAATEYQRVVAHYDLAKLARLESRFFDARFHLEYVLEHGNKLALRTHAQTKLEALPET